MSVPRRRLAAQGVTGAAAFAAARVRARLGGRPAPTRGSFMIHRWDAFVTWHDRPKGPPSSTRVVPTYRPYPPTAIVLQGPVVEESDFTVTSVRTYRTHFPECAIVVSTWDGLSPDVRRALEEAGAHVVTSALPAVPGLRNLTLQLVSTQAGLRAARDLGAEYVLKTRCDQRFFAPQTVPFLHALLTAFPLGPQAGSQRERLVVLDLITLLFVPYAISDMITFGSIDDVDLFWSAPPDERTPAEIDALPRRTPRENSVRAMVEIHVCRSFLDRSGWPVQDTLADWWRVLAERFVVVDAAMLDLLWVKYQLREYPHRIYDVASSFRTVQFADWLGWAANPGLAGIEVPEEVLAAPLG